MKKYNVQFVGLALLFAIFASGVAIGMEVPKLPSEVTTIIAQKALRVYLDELEEINIEGLNRSSGQLMRLQDRPPKGFLETLLGSKRAAPIDMIILLIENGANSNTKSYKGNTALHFLMNQIAFLKLGRNEGTFGDSDRKLNSKDIHDLLAVQSKIQQLVKHKININAQNDEGNTVAHILLDNAPDTNAEVYMQLLKFLKSLGVDMTIKNGKGLTPCEMAKQNNQDSWGRKWYFSNKEMEDCNG